MNSHRQRTSAKTLAFSRVIPVSWSSRQTEAGDEDAYKRQECSQPLTRLAMASLLSIALQLVLLQVGLCFSELLQASSAMREDLGNDAGTPVRAPLLRRSVPAPPPAASTGKTTSSTTAQGSGKQRQRGETRPGTGSNMAASAGTPDNAEPSLTCHAHCPRCPLCPPPPPVPTPTCPSPCAACPPMHPCPATCAPCPMCPACKPRIPPGYEHFPDHGYYRLHLTPSTWMEAKDTCEREGAHLAIINSQAEANLMKQLFSREIIQPNTDKFLYLGFHDLYKEGKYMTLLGQPLSATGYTTWNPGQPDNAGKNENCGAMYPSGGLNDLICSSRQIFVCEYPI